MADASEVNQNYTDIINGLSDGTKDISVNAGTFAGNVSISGNTTIGNASSDDLTVTASLASTIPIKTTNSYDIGSSTLGLRALYFGANSQTVNIKGSASMSATWTLTLPVTAGTSGYVLETDGSGTSSWTTRRVLQQVRASTVTYLTGTTTIPVDDTIPQNTEGDEYLTVSITPKSSSNILVIDGKFHVAHSSGITQIIGGVFQDTTADAICASWTTVPVANTPTPFVIEHHMTAGTTSSTTFKVRLGSPTAGTTQVNGASGARYLGGVMRSTLTVTEYSA